MNTFQIVLLGIFGAFIVVGVFVFATLSGGGGSEDPLTQPARATIWGTLDAGLISEIVRDYNNESDVDLDIQYREIRESEFDTELIEALASNEGPDAILLPQDRIVRHEDKIFPIPFQSIPERTFRDTFVEEGELYVTPQGVLGLPVLIDPLMLYWNRSIFNSEGIPQPPQYWDELVGITEQINEIDDSLNVLKSAIALGEMRNINNAKEIVATLIMQAGNPILLRNQGGERVGELRPVLTDSFGFSEPPTNSALRFYTEFSNPIKSVYSWNRALPDSREAFLAGDVALYLGFASELFELREKNPNLNFDVAPLPQIRESTNRLTFGTMHGFAVLKQSPDIAQTIRAISTLAGRDVSPLWPEKTGLPPVRRELLREVQIDAFRSTFYQEALVANAFLDPNPIETDRIFRELVENITSGRTTIGESVLETNEVLKKLVE